VIQLEGFEVAVSEIAAKVEHFLDSTQTPIVLIDGPAGSGKTTLALQLREALFQRELPVPRVVPMDDLYPGWEGLRQGAVYLVQRILGPLSRGEVASWQNWDWSNNQRGGEDVGNGHRSFEPGGILIVEGCGSLSQASKPLANLSIFIERDQAARAMAIKERDGNHFDPYWDLWLAQEKEFYEQENSKDLADYVVTNEPYLRAKCECQRSG
jgi:uridine kinase